MSFFNCDALSGIPLNAIPLKCLSKNNRECKIRPEIIDINGNERTFYPYSIEINKSSGSYNNINNPYAHLCVSDVVKNMNVKLLNLMLRTNDGRCIKWYETCKYKWILDESVYNKKKRWNNDKCRCKCKELIDNGSCNKGFIWNLSNCECECHKLCDVAEYFDYKNYKCRKMLID